MLLQVRQNMAFERIAAVRNHKLQTQQLQVQHQQQDRQGHQTTTGTVASQATSSKQQELQQCSSSPGAVGAQRVGHKSIPWSQLPPEEASQKMAAAAARHKALAGITTPDQKETEER